MLEEQVADVTFGRVECDRRVDVFAAQNNGVLELKEGRTGIDGGVDEQVVEVVLVLGDVVERRVTDNEPNTVDLDVPEVAPTVAVLRHTVGIGVAPSAGCILCSQYRS